MSSDLVDQLAQELQAAGANPGTSSAADIGLFDSSMIIRASQELDQREPVLAIIVNQRVADRLARIFSVQVKGLAEWMAGIQIIGCQIPARFIGIKRTSGIEIIDIMNYPRGTHERKVADDVPAA